MTEATKRPWDLAVTKSNYVIYSGSKQLGGTTVTLVPNKGWDNDRPNAEFIVKAVNSHDALVAALEDAVTWLHLASQNQGTSPLITKRHQAEAAKIETILEQVKNKRVNQ